MTSFVNLFPLAICWALTVSIEGLCFYLFGLMIYLYFYNGCSALKFWGETFYSGVNWKEQVRRLPRAAVPDVYRCRGHEKRFRRRFSNTSKPPAGSTNTATVSRCPERRPHALLSKPRVRYFAPEGRPASDLNPTHFNFSNKHSELKKGVFTDVSVQLPRFYSRY